MEPRQINDVNIASLLELEGQIVEPVPAEERVNYMYWRGAHLGNVALNFIRGRADLNFRHQNRVYFANDYQVAKNWAAGLTDPKGELRSQFDEQEQAEFAELTDIRGDIAFPSIVLALDNQYNHLVTAARDPMADESTFSLDAYKNPGRYGFAGGHYLEQRLKENMIDEYSRQAIKDILGKV